jgi:hypothetical protein
MKNKSTLQQKTKVSFDEETGKVTLAQTSIGKGQTMPLDVIEEQDRVEEGETRLDVPRDESVGIKQTNPKEVIVYKYDFELGDNGSDTEIVPRSQDDGIGGKKVTFEPEKADGYNSGNSDTYIQTLQDRPKPTPSGNPQNRSVANKEQMVRIAKLEKELKETKLALTEERLKRDREKYARKIVQAEIERGFFTPASDDEVDEKIESFLKNPVDVLANDLTRVRSLPSVASSSKNITTASTQTVKKGFDAFGGLQTGAANLIPNNGPEIKNTRDLYVATTKMGDNNITSLSQKIQENTRLGSMFSDESIEEYKKSPRL